MEKIKEYIKSLSKEQKFKIVSISLIVVFAFVFIVGSIDSCLNSDTLKKTVKRDFLAATGLRLSYNDMRLNLAFPLRLEAKFENPRILYPDNTILFSTDALDAQVEILPLIFKTVEISKVDANNLNVFLMRDKKGVFLGLEKIIPETPESTEIVPEETNTPDFNLILHNIKIKDYKFSMLDANAPVLMDVLLSGNNLQIDKFEKDKYVSVKTDGSVSINAQKHFTYDVSLKANLDSLFEDLVENEFLEEPKTDEEAVNPFYEISQNNLTANLVSSLVIKKADNIKGHAEVNSLSAKVNNFQLPDSLIKLEFKGDKVIADSKLYISPKAFLQVNGKVNYADKIDADLAIKTSELKLKELKDFLVAVGTVIPNFDMKNLKTDGSLMVDANIKSNPRHLECSGFVNLKNIMIGYNGVPATINKLNGRIVLNEQGALFDNIKANVDKSPLTISGNIDDKMNADISASIPKIELQSVLAWIRAANTDKNLKIQLDKIQTMKGFVSLSASLKGKLDKAQPQLLIKIPSFSIKHKDIAVPIRFSNGVLSLQEQVLKVDIPHFAVNSDKSSLKVSGDVLLKDKVEFDVKASGKLHDSDVSKLFATSGMAKGNVPVYVQIFGMPEKINAKLKVHNTPQNYVLLSGMDQSTDILLEGALKKNTFEIVNTGVYTASSKKLLDVEGKVTHLDKSDPKLHGIKIKTISPIKLNLPIGMPNSAFLSADMEANGSVASPKLKGYVKVQNLSLPKMQLSAGIIEAKIESGKLFIEVPSLKLKSSSVAVSAEGSSKIAQPYHLSRMIVSSPYLNLDEVSKLAESFPQPSSKSTYSKSSSAIANYSPLTINGGKFNADKIILNNTEFNNLSSNFTFDEKYDAHLTALKTTTMGGVADGSVTYNLMSGKVAMNVDASGINVEKFIVNFLAMPANTIKGMADAKANLTFKGATPEEITRTLNGNVNFTVNDGEMGNLGRLDYYLNAANIISNNIISSAINRVVNVSTLSKTGKFDQANGKLSFYNGGMMKINHLKVEGPKLSLFMKGTLNNLDSQGEIQIVGRLSQDMVQALGPLGQATLDRVVSAISPLTDIIRLTSSLYQTTVSATDKRQVPQLSQDNEGSKLFVVRINGNVYKPSSVRTFKWVQEHSAQQPQKSQQQSNPTSQEPQASDDNPQRQIDVEKLQQLIKDPKQILLRF